MSFVIQYIAGQGNDNSGNEIVSWKNVLRFSVFALSCRHGNHKATASHIVLFVCVN